MQRDVNKSVNFGTAVDMNGLRACSIARQMVLAPTLPSRLVESLEENVWHVAIRFCLHRKRAMRPNKASKKVH